MNFSLFILDRLTIHDQNSKRVFKTALLIFVLASLDCCSMGEEAALRVANVVCYRTIVCTRQILLVENLGPGANTIGVNSLCNS